MPDRTQTEPTVGFTTPPDGAPGLPPVRFVRYGLGSKTEDLLRAALAEFMEVGEATSPERIAERAGAGANSFYRLFKQPGSRQPGGQKARCFDLLFEECWYVLNQVLADSRESWDFSRSYTAERVILDDVATLLRLVLEGRAEAIALDYVVQTSSRPFHLSTPSLKSEQQAQYEDRLLALGKTVIVQNGLTGTTAIDVLDEVFTTWRATVAAWMTPGGKFVKLESALDHIRSFLQGSGGGGAASGPDAEPAGELAGV